ncbi:jg15008 [Pararge aegeria aegeria]|uniref:Jg15008 protein n=1 Tax=Pararge aegeria aegeria TaxID=348720 RepID=A0A8S4QHM6_9NEOP|nr:jg15008 [Pararge aegeria aegeria]
MVTLGGCVVWRRRGRAGGRAGAARGCSAADSAAVSAAGGEGRGAAARCCAPLSRDARPARPRRPCCRPPAPRARQISLLNHPLSQFLIRSCTGAGYSIN